MNIGEQLKALRIAKQLSHGDIEKRTGLLRSYVSRVENGHTVPKLENLERWAKGLDVGVHQIFVAGEGKPETVPANAIKPPVGREEKLLGFFRRADEADKQLMLDIACKLARRMAYKYKR